MRRLVCLDEKSSVPISLNPAELVSSEEAILLVGNRVTPQSFVVPIFVTSFAS